MKTMTDRAEVRARLAEKFVLPDGTYPLRQQCPCFEYLRTGESDWIRCLPCGSCARNHNDTTEDGACIFCDGLDYVFNDAPDAIWNAVLAKGGTLRAWIDQRSGMFVAECRLGSSLNEQQLAEAYSMAEALKLAVLRALEATNGN